jgi:hypothetical protein
MSRSPRWDQMEATLAQLMHFLSDKGASNKASDLTERCRASPDGAITRGRGKLPIEGGNMAAHKVLLVAGRRRAVLGVSGRATPQRLPAVPTASIPSWIRVWPVRYLVSRETDTFRQSVQSCSGAIVAVEPGAQRPSAARSFLMISGGDNGAFGAGLLRWTAAGTRPSSRW